MIIITPFEEKEVVKGKGPPSEFPKEFFSQITGFTGKAMANAIQLTLSTAWAMLGAGVVNRDQGHNILYRRDGTPLFIDMGMAVATLAWASPVRAPYNGISLWYTVANGAPIFRVPVLERPGKHGILVVRAKVGEFVSYLFFNLFFFRPRTQNSGKT